LPDEHPLAGFLRLERTMKHGPTPAPLPEPITLRIADFCAASGLSRPTVYRMLGRGELESITIGTRRLIVMDSYRRLIARQLGGEL
jgi:excisionase family DNA binding protein